ncbi:MAG: YbaY family lipoprotein, partial [Chloroflexota bacterium]
GVPVLTKGNPSKVDITLTYRPDLLKGAVTGQITGVGISPSPAAYAMTVLVDPSTGDSLGIQVQTVDDGLPVGFSVAYAITDIKPDQDYVVTAEVGDEGVTWRNAAGVPVITNGNPKSGVQVVVTPVVAAAASPTVAPAPTASPTPSPLEPTSQGSSLLAIIILIAIIVAIVAFFVARGRAETPPPTDGEGGAAGAAAVAGTEASEATEATDATATGPSEPPTAPPA